MKKEDRITGIFVPAEGNPRIREIDNTLEALQDTVGGYIETLPIARDRRRAILIVCDEEGRLNGKPENRNVREGRLAGDLFICAAVGEEFVSLTAKEIKDIALMFRFDMEEDIRIRYGGRQWIK